jgi:lipopolysaccharide cholinephosphotransferase
MEELNLEQRKKISLDLLLAFDSFCQTNGIKYSIAYGTLLGAVRHKGFIPWDDDIDVLLPRSDYERFF